MSFYKSIINLPKPIVSHLVQVITGHTYLKRHQAVIDESERQRILEALDWDNADDDGNAACGDDDDGDDDHGDIDGHAGVGAWHLRLEGLAAALLCAFGFLQLTAPDLQDV